jgi:putative Ca2+/H+ antiporter (TMEM165/GDT1 family)
LFAADKDVNKLTVFFGASLALIVASGVGVLAGGIISQYISAKHLNYIAGIGFIGIGIWTLFKG